MPRRLPARPPGGEFEDRSGVRTFEAIAADVADLVLEFGGALSASTATGWSAARSMRRCTGGPLRGVSADKRGVRSSRHSQPGQDRRLAATGPALPGQRGLRRCRLCRLGARGSRQRPRSRARGARHPLVGLYAGHGCVWRVPGRARGRGLRPCPPVAACAAVVCGWVRWVRCPTSDGCWRRWWARAVGVRGRRVWRAGACSRWRPGRWRAASACRRAASARLRR